MEREKWLRAIGLVLIVIGVLALVLALLMGEADVALLVIVPVIYGAGALGALAILLIFAGMVVLFLSYAAAPVADDGPSDGRPEGSGTKREFGGVILIGPIPIVFGSARSLRGSWALAIMAILTVIVLMLFLFILLR